MDALGSPRGRKQDWLLRWLYHAPPHPGRTVQEALPKPTGISVDTNTQARIPAVVPVVTDYNMVGHSECCMCSL